MTRIGFNHNRVCHQYGPPPTRQRCCLNQFIYRNCNYVFLLRSFTKPKPSNNGSSEIVGGCC